MPKIKDTHDCEKMGCKGEKLKGIKIECNRCDKIWYLECWVDEDDVYELLKCIGMIKLTSENDDINIKTSVNEQKKEILNTIIGPDTSIEYVCITCKKDGKTKNKIRLMNKEIEQLNKKLETESEKYIDLKRKYGGQITTELTEIDWHWLTKTEKTEKYWNHYFSVPIIYFL